LGKEKCAFPFSFSNNQQTPMVRDMHPAKQREVALLHATREGSAAHTNYLSIQGNPKADFLE
jgi:hypothetical protein